MFPGLKISQEMERARREGGMHGRGEGKGKKRGLER